MSVVAVAAVKSSPGASTLCELVVQLRPATSRRCVLADCDPFGGDWLLRPGVAPEPGLVSLAAAGRHGLEHGELLRHLQRLGEGLEVMVAPAAARQASGALGLVAECLAVHLRALEGMDAVVDCGCLLPASPALPLVRGAELVVLVSRPTARAMVHVAPWVDQLAGEGLPTVVVLGTGPRSAHEPDYRPEEVAEALGVDVLGPLAHDPSAAARLFQEPGNLGSLRGSALVNSATTVAEAVFARVDRGPVAPPSVAWQTQEVR